MAAGSMLSPEDLAAQGLRHPMHTDTAAAKPSSPSLSLSGIVQDLSQRGAKKEPPPAAKQAAEEKKEYNPHRKQKTSRAQRIPSRSVPEDESPVSAEQAAFTLKQRSAVIEERVKPRKDTAASKPGLKTSAAKEAKKPQHYTMDRAARIAAAEARFGSIGTSGGGDDDD